MPKIKDISELSDDAKASLGEFVEQAKQVNAARAAQRIEGAPDSVNAAVAGANVEVIDDLSDGSSKREKPAEDDETGVAEADKLTHCPHCQWELRVQDIPDPSEDDRQAYLESLLGSKPFQREVSLLDGMGLVTFRELLHDELDAVYRAALAEVQKKSETYNEFNFMEVLGRYRAAAQLVRLQLGDNVEVMPPSLKQWVNPAPQDLRDVVPKVYAKVFEEVLAKESLARIVRIEADRFNRLLAKLEANVHRPNFWNPAH